MHEFGRMIQPAYRVLLFLAMAGKSPRRSTFSRCQAAALKAHTGNTLIATYDFARRDGWQFRVAAIPPDYAMTSTTFNFDTDYMRGLFDLGFSMGRTGEQWQSSLKALATSGGVSPF